MAATGWFKRSRPEPAGRPLRVLTASSRRLDLASKSEGRQIRALRMGWQSEAWNYRDSIGELRYAIQFLANSAGRMLIYIAAEPNDGESDNPVPLSDVPGMPASAISIATQALLDLGRGKLALKGLLKILSTNISVAGECFMLGQQDPETGEETWSIRSVDELVIKDDCYWLREIPDGPQGIIPWVKLDPDLSVVSRIWIPHPRFSLVADSPLKAMLDDAESLSILRRGIRSDGRSRLGRGILFVPDELSIKVPLNDDEDPESDPFMSSLTQALMEPIGDEGVASAVVPIVIRGPADAGKEIKHIPLAAQFAKEAKETRDELIGIIATSFDLPKEVIQGIADLNHWCQPTDTEVLTERGWLGEDAIMVGDVALSLNHETGESEWQPVTGVYRADVTDLPMLSIEHRLHSSLTTMAHRWPVLSRRGHDQHWTREWTTSGDLRTQDHIITAAPSAALPTVPKYSDAFVETIAWLFTEGEIRQPGDGHLPQVRLYQSHAVNRAKCNQIANALTVLHGPPSASPMHRSTGDRPQWRRIELD